MYKVKLKPIIDWFDYENIKNSKLVGNDLLASHANKIVHIVNVNSNFEHILEFNIDEDQQYNVFYPSDIEYIIDMNICNDENYGKLFKNIVFNQELEKCLNG